MAKFTITIETDNPDAREVLCRICESQIIAVDTDNAGTMYDTEIIAIEEGADMPGAVVYGCILDGAANNENAR